jgi:hypothetical protein
MPEVVGWCYGTEIAGCLQEVRIGYTWTLYLLWNGPSYGLWECAPPNKIGC